MSQEEWSNASHLFCVKGWSTLRFNEFNVNKSCVECNMTKEGNTVEYLKRLPVRIGQKNVDELLRLSREDRKVNFKWQRHEIEEKTVYYKERCKDLSG